ncbi:MAG: hypothetical protein U0269_35075 [Polyangiales bacterium]
MRTTVGLRSCLALTVALANPLALAQPARAQAQRSSAASGTQNQPTPAAGARQSEPSAGAAQRGVTGPDGVRRYWMADAYLVGGFNQLTLALLTGLRFRWDQPRSDNLLLDNRRFEIGFEVNVNPGFTSLGGYAEWTPLQILILRLQTDVYAHYGTYGAIMRFDRPDVGFGDALRDICQGCRAGFNQRVLARAVLQAQLGPVAVRNQTDVGFYALHGDEPYYILIEHDILAARREVIVVNESQLLFEPYRRADKTGLFVGPMYHFARTLFAGVQRQRVGAFAEWIFHRKLGPFARPRHRLRGLSPARRQPRRRIDRAHGRRVRV